MKNNGFIFEPPLLKPVSYSLEHGLLEQIKNWRFNRRKWEIQEDWVLYSDYLKLYIKIPAKFTCDGASVPHALKFMVSSCDGLFYGAIVHDFIYRFNQLIVAPPETFDKELRTGSWEIWEEPGKLLADKLLYQIPKELEGFNMPNLIAYIMKPSYFIAWQQWRKLNYKLTTPNPDPDNEGLTSME